MIILHVYSNIREDRQVETQAFVEEMKKKGWPITSIMVIDINDYAKVINDHLGLDDLIILEQDIVPTEKQLIDLVCSPDSWCGYHYVSRYEDNFYPPRKIPRGMGFVKFSWKIQAVISIPENTHWSYIDTLIAKNMDAEKIKFHDLGEVKHNKLERKP